MLIMGQEVNKSEFFWGYWDAQIPRGRVKQKVIFGMRIYHWDYEAFYRTWVEIREILANVEDNNTMIIFEHSCFLLAVLLVSF